MPKPKYRVVSNSRGLHNFPVGTVVRFIRHADPLKDFTGDATTKLPTLYEGVANDQLIRQWLSPDEVSLV
jgi:hypothetical protein